MTLCHDHDIYITYGIAPDIGQDLGPAGLCKAHTGLRCVLVALAAQPTVLVSEFAAYTVNSTFALPAQIHVADIYAPIG